MKSMAVFDAPPVPGCWPGGEVIRIVDPLGLQVAWVSPALAGGLVGYYVRASGSEAWTEVLACSAASGRESGSELLMRDQVSGQMIPAQGTDATWTFASRDPTETTVSGQINDHALRISLWCADGELHIDLAPGKQEPSIPETGLRLHLASAVGEPVSASLADGEISFRGGTLASLAFEHSPELVCRVRPSGRTGEHQVDFVPASERLPTSVSSPVSIRLFPTPSPR